MEEVNTNMMEDEVMEINRLGLEDTLLGLTDEEQSPPERTWKDDLVDQLLSNLYEEMRGAEKASSDFRTLGLLGARLREVIEQELVKASLDLEKERRRIEALEEKLAKASLDLEEDRQFREKVKSELQQLKVLMKVPVEIQQRESQELMKLEIQQRESQIHSLLELLDKRGSDNRRIESLKEKGPEPRRSELQLQLQAICGFLKEKSVSPTQEQAKASLAGSSSGERALSTQALVAVCSGISALVQLFSEQTMEVVEPYEFLLLRGELLQCGSGSLALSELAKRVQGGIMEARRQVKVEFAVDGADWVTSFVISRIRSLLDLYARRRMDALEFKELRNIRGQLQNGAFQRSEWTDVQRSVNDAERRITETRDDLMLKLSLVTEFVALLAPEGTP
ncbi:hypothetical protein R1flu_026942 [Riccia fluitans]|uniref:Uncharacterized protein n=1 Tax=Riccia fluitans TaxID=41844 RepID=A0ABD1XHZ1_9MARC